MTSRKENVVPRECPLIPMGAITGKPTREQMRTMLSAYRSVGITQYLIYPRSGCEYEFMSPEWLAFCKGAVADAADLGFTSIWLYDEFNWPSGTCACTIPRDRPELRLQEFCLIRQKNGKEAYVRRTRDDYVNVLDPRVAKEFIKRVHEPFYRALKPWFGKLIKGIFTDEPGIGYFHWWEHKDILTHVPWYDGIEEDYARTYPGFNLREDMKRASVCPDNSLQERLYPLLGERYRAAFIAPIETWCEAHGIVLTGHLMNEFAPRPAHNFNGDILKVLGSFGLPGNDEIFTWTDIKSTEWLTLGTTQYAVEARGNQGGLAELFAFGPISLKFAEMRHMIWKQVLHGVDHFVLAVAALDHRGCTAKNWLVPFTPTSPWFPALKKLGEEAQLATSFATKERVYDVEIRYPQQDVPLNTLLQALVRAQISWRFLRPEDTPQSPCVIVPGTCNFTLEGQQNSFWNLEKLVDKLLALCPSQAYVENSDGQRDANVFVRRYADGGVVVLDMLGEGRELTLVQNGARIPFWMPPLGVQVFPGWNVQLDAPNTLVACFQDGKFEFTVEEELEKLALVSREYDGPVKLLLDGKPITCKNVCDLLPQGYRELFRQSKPFTLTAGKHTLTLASEAKQYGFLPIAWLCGSFASDRQDAIRPYENDGRGLGGYAGTITQTACVQIPQTAVLLSVDSQKLPVELFLNGVSCGYQAWEPFAWRVPAELAGQIVEVKLVRYTDASHLFDARLRGIGMKADFDLPWYPFLHLQWQTLPLPTSPFPEKKLATE